MFQKHSSHLETNAPAVNAATVETIVGPSVKVDGDFVSEGNILVQGIVNGNVKTARHLEVQQGAKILANIKAESAKIAGEIRGNIKVNESLELTSTAVIIGDVDAKTLVVAGGAILHGRCVMSPAEMAVPAPQAAETTSAQKKRGLNRTLAGEYKISDAKSSLAMGEAVA